MEATHIPFFWTNQQHKQRAEVTSVTFMTVILSILQSVYIGGRPGCPLTHWRETLDLPLLGNSKCNQAYRLFHHLFLTSVPHNLWKSDLSFIPEFFFKFGVWHTGQQQTAGQTAKPCVANLSSFVIFSESELHSKILTRGFALRWLVLGKQSSQSYSFNQVTLLY